MKAAKIIGFVLGGVILLVALLAIVALMPGVQTWAVRKAVGGQPGIKIDIGRVAAGLSTANLSDVRIVQNGMVITAKGMTARYSAWDYLSRQRINADLVEVQDLLIDLRAAQPASTEAGGKSGTPAPTAGTTPTDKNSVPAGKSPGATAERPASFNGILSQAQLPFDVRVARLAAKGRALLPQEQTVVFDLQGAGIETGQRGKLEWKIDFADPKSGAPLSALRVVGTTGIHIATDRRIDLIELDATASAQGPKLPAEQIKVELKAEQPAAGTNEGYAFLLGLVRNDKVEPLLKSAAQFQAATREFSGAWDLAVRTEQLAGMLAGFGLPEVAATGGGKFSFVPATGAVAASGDLQGNVSQLDKLAPQLARIGAMQFRTTFDGGLAEGSARLERLQLEFTGADGRKVAQISTLQRVGFSLSDQRVTLADPKAELARVTIQALPLAWAQPFVEGLAIDSGDLSLALAIEAEPDGSRVRARALEPIAIRSATVRSGDKKLVDQLTFSANPRVDYSAARIVGELADLKISTPAGDTLSGAIHADVTNLATTPAVAFSTELQVRSVAAHKPYLPLDIGPIGAVIATEGRLEGEVLRVTKATHTLSREGGALLAALELQQPVTANLKATTFSVPNPAATAARLRLGEVPLAWAEAFVANSKFEGMLAGATLEVSARSAEDLTVNTTEPLTVRGASVTMEGKPLARALDLSANLTATKRGDVIAYDVRRVEVKQGQALLAGLSATGEAKLGGKLTLTAKGNLEADAALLNQPAAVSFATLSRGKLTTAFEATMAEAIQAKAVVTARGLVARQNNQPLGDLSVSLDANVKPDGSGTFTAPLTLTNGPRRSDVGLNGTFGKTADGKSFLFAGKIASNQLFVDDFQPLAGLAPTDETKPAAPAASSTPVVRAPAPAPAPRPGTPRATAPVASAPPTNKPTRDAKPFWQGVNGKLELDLKRIVYGKDYIVSGVRGAGVVTDSKLSLDGLQGQFRETPFKLNGALTFDTQNPQPYALTAVTDVREFDVGAFLRAANPNERPALETKATVLANLNGKGGTLGELAKNVFGKFELSAGKGVTPLFARKGALGTAVGIGSIAAQVLGARNDSDTTVAIGRLATLLNEVHFDSVKIQVERGADLQLKISSLEIVSPLLRATGSGAVAHQPNTDLVKQPMEILLQLGARAELAQIFNRLTTLPAPDANGYQLLQRTFRVGGTAGQPDSSALWKYLVDLATEKTGLPAGLGSGLGEILQRGLKRE